MLSLCPREGNRSAPIRRVCSVKSTRPRGEGPRGGKQDSCFSTDFSASSVTREQSPLFFGTKNVKIEFQNLYYSSINTAEKRVQIRDSITISFSFSFFSPIFVVSYFDEIRSIQIRFAPNNTAQSIIKHYQSPLHEFEYGSERNPNGIEAVHCAEHCQNGAKQSRICATRSETISKRDTDLLNFLFG